MKRLNLFFRTLLAVTIALLIGAVLIIVSGHNPIEAYLALFKGAFFDYYGFGNTLVRLSPILLAGLAVLVPLRAGLYNIGAEGQIYMGALFATITALYAPEQQPVVHIVFCSLAGMAGGALWAAIPGVLRAYFNVNEVIITLLLNYVAINIVSFFVSGPMMEPGAPYPYSKEISDNLWLPYILPGTDAHAGSIIGLVLTLLITFVFSLTRLGARVDLAGANPVAAAYTGLNVKKTILLSMAFGGAMAGLAGTFEILGLKYRLFHLFSHGYGYDGIVVAFLSAGQPILLPIAALFLSGLKAGANIMQRSVGTEASIVIAIQGLVVIFIAIDVVLREKNITLRQVLKRRKQ